MGKIGEWEKIAERIEERELFEAVMSFEEMLIRLFFPSYEAEYSEGVSDEGRGAREHAAPSEDADKFFGECETVSLPGGDEYDAEDLWEDILRLAEGFAAENAAGENIAGKIIAGENIADKIIAGENIADKIIEGENIEGENITDKIIADENITAYTAEENAAYMIGEDAAIFGTGGGAEYEITKAAEAIEDVFPNALSAESLPEGGEGGEYGAAGERLFKAMYESAKEYGTEEAAVSEAHINEFYGAERMGRSGAKRIIESASAGGGGESREVRIEMVNNNNISSRVDIDEVADMLTMRICDIMSRSADGIY